jgi:hypothetical protein
MLARCLALTLIAASAATGCSSSSGAAGSDNPTLVAVDPEAFLGSVPCLDSPGAMRRYVATIEDVTGELGGPEATIDSFVLPSSPPVSCTLPVAFGFVVDEHRYVADVDGYDTTAIEPLVPGSPFMVSWTTSCGRQNEGTNRAVAAQTQQTIYVRGCAELVDHRPDTTPTGARVGLDSALGGLECGDESGSVNRFTVSLEGGSGPPVDGECGADVTIEGLSVPGTYVFHVAAFEPAGDTPSWGTTCYAVAQSGTLVDATCDPLSSDGVLEVEVPALLAEAGQTCGEDGVARVVVSLPASGGPLTSEQVAPECDEAMRFEDLPAGYYELTVQTELGDGSEGPVARCEAEVEPVSVSVADCDLL